MENFEKIYCSANENILPSPDFTERTMDRIFGEQKVTRFPARKTLLLIAAVILLLALGACTAVVIQYIANKTPLSYNQYYSSASDQYASPVNLYAESSGVEIVLTEAVFQNDILTMTFDYEVDGHDVIYALSFFGELKVDGQNTFVQNNGVCYYDGIKSWYVIEFDLSHFNLTGIHQFDLSVDEVCLMASPELLYEEFYSGPWNFSFSLDTSVLTEDTVVYTIDKYITVDNGDEIYLDKIICNPMTQRLIFIVPHPDYENFTRFYELDAKSSDGTLNFIFYNCVENRCESINFNPDAFDLSAETLTLTVSIAGGDNGEACCDPFEIVCTKKSE